MAASNLTKKVGIKSNTTSDVAAVRSLPSLCVDCIAKLE